MDARQEDAQLPIQWSRKHAFIFEFEYETHHNPYVDHLCEQQRLQVLHRWRIPLRLDKDCVGRIDDRLQGQPERLPREREWLSRAKLA